MTLADYDKSLLCIVMWREARGEGMDGMRAVGHVIKNRVAAWNQSWAQVICSPNQFSSISIRNDPNGIVWPNPSDSFLMLVETIYSGQDLDLTHNSIYYANEEIATSGWYQQEIIDSGKHPVAAKIGHHTFRL